jgi:hypothetical protein
MPKEQSSPLKRAFETGAGVTLFVVAVVIYVVINSGWQWLALGTPTIPSLADRWWAGYYDTASGRVWCVARFYTSSSGSSK